MEVFRVTPFFFLGRFFFVPCGFFSLHLFFSVISPHPGCPRTFLNIQYDRKNKGVWVDYNTRWRLAAARSITLLP